MKLTKKQKQELLNKFHTVRWSEFTCNFIEQNLNTSAKKEYQKLFELGNHGLPSESRNVHELWILGYNSNPNYNKQEQLDLRTTMLALFFEVYDE